MSNLSIYLLVQVTNTGGFADSCIFQPPPGHCACCRGFAVAAVAALVVAACMPFCAVAFFRSLLREPNPFILATALLITTVFPDEHNHSQY